MRGALLPASGASFSRKKERILELLGVPDAEYSDASPKGSVDGGIRDLIDEINALDGFVTTSSCAGRVSVFVEGRKAAGEGGDEEGPAGGGVDGAEVGEKEEARSKPATIAAVGGKGGGGAWLFVSHDPVPIVKEKEARGLLGLTNPEPTQGAIKTEMTVPRDSRLIHFKFEPMVGSAPNHSSFHPSIQENARTQRIKEEKM
jgi:tRNA wybutosine-synthesizing protein 3